MKSAIIKHLYPIRQSEYVGYTDCDEKIMNIIINTSILLMSVMMGGLTKIVVNVGSAMSSAMAGAVGGQEADGKVKEIEQLPEADQKIKALVSDMRKDIYAQFEQKRKEIEPMLSDPAFDLGPKIIEKYEFKLPKLTEELSDATLAQYARLLVREDPNFVKMFKELSSWMNTLPKPPENINKN